MLLCHLFQQPIRLNLLPSTSNAARTRHCAIPCKIPMEEPPAAPDNIIQDREFTGARKLASIGVSNCVIAVLPSKSTCGSGGYYKTKAAYQFNFTASVSMQYENFYAADSRLPFDEVIPHYRYQRGAGPCWVSRLNPIECRPCPYP